MDAIRSEIPMPVSAADAERFDAKVIPTDAGCWEWQAAHTPQGYGVFWYAGALRRAHRLSYARHVGPIPRGLDLDHLCRNPKCVKPDHLEPVTRGENVMRGTNPIAANSAKTNCPQGHPYSLGNTIVKASGARECRECKYTANRERARRKQRERIS